MKQDPIKFAVEDHLSARLSKGSFSHEILARVEQRIAARVVYYDELFKDNPEAKKIAIIFEDKERATLATYEKYQEDDLKDHEYKINTFFRDREIIIKNFFSPGLSKSQMKELYLQDRVNNPKKYLFSPNKKSLIKDWAKHFPEMAIVNKRTSIFKRVGPLILSITLYTTRSFTDSYYVGFRIKHLLFNYPKEEFFFQDIIDARNHPYIDVIAHKEGHYVDLIEMIREQFWLPLEGEITFAQICRIFDSIRVILQGFPDPRPLLCAWAGEAEAAQQYYEKVLNMFKNKEDKEIQQAIAYRVTGGKIFNVGDVALWEKMFTEQVQDYIKHPEKLRAIVKTNVENFGLGSIPYQDIVGVRHKEKA